MKKDDPFSLATAMQTLEKIESDFRSAGQDLELMMKKHKEAQVLAGQILHHLERVENELEVVNASDITVNEEA